MATVLCTGVHEGLIRTRKLILEGAGHIVVTAMSSPDVVAACHNFKLDVAVIGQSGQPNTKREWAALVRKHCPVTKILEIYIPSDGCSVTSADSWLESPAIPDKLAERIAALSGQGTGNAQP